MSRLLQGLAGAPGLAMGPAWQIRQHDADQGPGLLVGEAALQQLALATARLGAQLERLSAELRAAGQPDEAAIMDAHALLASDPLLTAEVERRVRQEGQTLQQAILQASSALAESLSSLEDAYLRERAADVRAVGEQLIAALVEEQPEQSLPDGAIVLASELTPTQLALVRRAGAAGIATSTGTPTGHVAILARAYGLPAVVGLGPELLQLPDQILVVLDGATGQLLVQPAPEQLERYQEQAAEQRRRAAQRRGLAPQPACTSDGHRIALWANIGSPQEVELALQHGAEGIGLFRTEFLFLDRPAPPSEQEQLQAYGQVVRAMAGRPVIIRTLDVGGDKPIPYLPQLQEENPFLGTRGLRFCMRYPELFQTQLRALLRAGAAGDLRIMLPMVTTAEEVAWAREQLQAASQALAAQGLEQRATVPLGIMVETPAAALTLDLLAPLIDFCSIGSNDLAQYVLAADRGNPELASRYGLAAPAVLRLIGQIVLAAQRLELELSLCGQLAGEVEGSLLLVGLGLSKLSMAPGALLEVKEALGGVTLDEARRRASAAAAS